VLAINEPISRRRRVREMGEQELSTSSGTDRMSLVLALGALSIACVVFAFIGFVLAFFTDSCGVASTTCEAGLVAVGTAIAGVFPWLLTVAGTIAVAIRIKRSQPVGRLPWVSLIGALLVAAIGVGIVFFGGGFGGEALGNGAEPMPEE
jgi:hypothetical protein